MCRVEVPLIAVFEWSRGGGEHTILEDADLIGEDVNIEHPAARGVRDLRLTLIMPAWERRRSSFNTVR
jgi:hypothetical protein